MNKPISYMMENTRLVQILMASSFYQRSCLKNTKSMNFYMKCRAMHLKTQVEQELRSCGF